jgi:hypothetical protein
MKINDLVRMGGEGWDIGDRLGHRGYRMGWPTRTQDGLDRDKVAAELRTAVIALLTDSAP